MSSSAPRPEGKRIAWGLLAALAVYVGLRALILHTAFDEVALWMYELYPMGTMAEFLHRGIDFPLSFYYDNAAGQLLSGFLTWPAFAIAGPTYLALKAAPALMGVGVLLLSWRWLRDSYGRGAANLCAWMLALAPTTFLKYSLTNSGNHFENIFFSVLTIAAFARLQRLGASRGRLFAFGLCAGLALFVFLGALLPIGILGLLHLGIRGLRAALRDLGWFLSGFLVGQLPLIAINLSTGGRGLGFLGQKFSGENAGTKEGSILGRMFEYLWQAPFDAATYPDALGRPGSFWNACFFLALVGVWLWALPGALRCLWSFLRADRAREAALGKDWLLVLCVGYVPLSALAFGLSDLRLGGYGGKLLYGGYRYYLPWFLYGMLSAAVLASRAWNARGAWRGVGLLTVCGVLLPGLANFALVDWSFSQTGMGLHYSGYDSSKAARGLLAARNALSHEEQLRRLEAFPPQMRAGVARALGFNLAVMRIAQSRKAGHPNDWSVELCAIASEWPESLRHELARGAGIGLRFTCGANESAALLPPLRRTLERNVACPEALPWFLEGLASSNPNLPLAGQTDLQSIATHKLLDLARAQGLPLDVQRGIARGQGFLFGQLARRGIESDLEALAARRAELPAELLPDFYAGLGSGCALQGEQPGGPDPRLPLPAEYAPAFWSSFVRELRQSWASDSAALEAQFQELVRTLPGEESLGLRAALAGH